MLQAKDLMNYLKQQGFDIQSARMAETISGNLIEITEECKNSPYFNLPFTRGFEDVKLSECFICNKKFANDQCLGDHVSNVHSNEQRPRISQKSSDATDEEKSDSKVLTQYELFDNDFLGDCKDENSFYLVLKINDCFDELHPKIHSNGKRRARRIETKPRKVYAKPGQPSIKTESENKIDVLMGPFNCVRCEGVFDGCCEYSKHFHDEHSKKKSTAYKCQICEKRFNKKEPYPQNDEEEENDPNLSELNVISCGDVAIKPKLLNNVKTLKCEYEQCNKTFTTYATLNQHTKLHSGIRPYICKFESCMKSFSQKSGLEQHMRTHTAQRPYTCVICNSSFRQSAHLIHHMRTHSKLQPYSCQLCPRKFKQSTHLTHHIQSIHSGI